MEQRKRVLLVDEVRLILEMERSLFSRDQVAVTVARNGQEALHSLQVLKPQLVIMDLQMPGMDGAEVCRRIKADPDFCAVPVILTTGTDHAAELHRCHAAGCDAVIGKPLNRRKLLDAARRFLAMTERAAPRVITRMLVQYGIEDQQTLHDFSVNLASGGMFLETSQLLPIDTPLSLEFFIPGAPATTRSRARVAWANPAGDQTKPDLPSGLGIQFLDMASQDSRAIRKFIRSEYQTPI
jgi:uncharacterized protein (TIGR02266 family)